MSEIFPLEIRALAIAIFYAIGTLVGGVGAPVLFGWIIGTGSSTALFTGYLLAAVLMVFGALVEAWIGVAAEFDPDSRIWKRGSLSWHTKLARVYWAGRGQLARVKMKCVDADHSGIKILIRF